MTMETMGPAQPYLRDTGFGIDWQPGVAHRYEGGQIVASAAHQTATPWEFWMQLAFRDLWPDVTFWWFRTIWTGDVTIHAPDDVLGTMITGWVTYHLLEDDRRPWMLDDDHTAVLVDVSLPPFHTDPANIGLRLQLARQVLHGVQGGAPWDQRLQYTSLIHRDELPHLLATSHAAAAQALGGTWRLARGGKVTPYPPRQELCVLLGLEPPA